MKSQFFRERIFKLVVLSGQRSALAFLCLYSVHFSLAKANSTAAVSSVRDNASGKVAAELAALHAKSNIHTSFRVKFEQKVFSALRKKTTISAGELIFSKPRKFRWEISNPGKELYINNGEWFWKYVENTKHAMRLPANASDLEFLDVVFQLDKLPHKFSLEKVNSFATDESQGISNCPTNHTCVVLEPLKKSGQKNISLAIDEASGFVSIIKIEFRNGNKTNITFNSFKPGIVAASSFEFTPPPGTAVDKR